MLSVTEKLARLAKLKEIHKRIILENKTSLERYTEEEPCRDNLGFSNLSRTEKLALDY